MEVYFVEFDFNKKGGGFFTGYLENESYVLVNGLFILSVVIFVIVFYLFRVSEKKKKFYFVEVLMKEGRENP